MPENDDDWEGLAAAVYRAVLQMLPASAMSWFGSLRDRSLAVATEVYFCTTQPCKGNMGVSDDLGPQRGILTSSNGPLSLYTDNEWSKALCTSTVESAAVRNIELPHAKHDC